MSKRRANLRSKPVQARSRATFEKILATAAELMEEVGWDGFNTNLLAERSGFRVSAIYRYFPNKIAVISLLAENFVAEWDNWVLGFDQLLEQGQDISSAWRHYVTRFPVKLRNLPGGMAVRRAMKVSPELREIDQRDNQLLAEQLAISLRKAMPHLPSHKAQYAGRILVESVVTLLDFTMDMEPRNAKAIMAELLIMHDAYFEKLQSRNKG